MTLNSYVDLNGATKVLLADYLCIQSGEEILLTADTNTDMALCRALCQEAERLGAHAVVLLGSCLPYQGRLADPYISSAHASAVMACDVWIDLAFPYFAGSYIHDKALKNNRVRYLLVGDLGAKSFQRLFGSVDFDAYFKAQQLFDELMHNSEGKICRITTEIGTDVSFKLARTMLTKPRHCNKPGMYLVPGSCSIAPQIETVEGVIVVTAAFHEYYEKLPSPITIEIKNKIQSVTGGGASRVSLERALLRAGGGEYGSVIHFTHGLHPAARMTGSSFIEDMRTIGANAIGLGLPWWEPGGGENHPDAIITEHSMSIDDEQIIDRGVIVSPKSLSEKAAQLAPLHQTAIKRKEQT